MFISRARIEALEDRLEEEGWLESVVSRRITVHTIPGLSIEGSLVATTVDGVILRAAKLLESGNLSTPMAGEVFIPRTNIAFAQLDE